MKRSFRSLSVAALMPLSLTVTFAQAPPAAGAGRQMPPQFAAAQAGKPRSYADVVTKDAVTQDGIFKVHQIDDRYLFEIPSKALGRELLWKATTAGGNAEDAFAGQLTGMSMIRFVRQGNRIFMRQVDTDLRPDGDDEGFKRNVELNSQENIVGVYNVMAEAPNGGVVIDATNLFLGNPSDIGSRRGGTPGSVDASRSFIEKVKAFPTNIEVSATATLTNPLRGATTERVHYSMVALPEKPMTGRFADSRIGFFSTDFTTIGSANNRVETKGYITRFRLEKKDPSAPLSEPVKPITWVISNEVPAKWRKWVKKGIEDWNVAFEQAGFKNAIVAVDAPNDPDWSPEDARYSVVRWSPRAVQNAYAGPISDPRSGETLSAQMVVFQDVMKLAQGWYFAQCGAVDPRAAKLPLNDELEGELIRYVVAHECGHALGLFHNWKASSHYSVAQLRDPKFTAENGVSASIMDYSRFNYVAQPGDGVKQLIGKIGPYDKFAIQWGYSPIAGTTKPEDEERTLDTWLGRQIADPRLRYWPEQDPLDPAAQNEDIGNDAVAVDRLGFKNLDRIAQNLLVPSTSKFGKDYSFLAEMHNYLMGQRLQETVHVLKNVGGVVGNDYHAGRGGDVYTPVPKAKQSESVKFLVNEALQPSAALYAPTVLNRIQATGAASTIFGQQSMVLSSLFADGRLQRLTDNEALNGSKAYTVSNLMSDVTSGVWNDLDATKPQIGLVRRSLQRAYLRALDLKVNPAAPSQTDAKMLAVGTLKGLASRIDKAMARTTDPTTKLHLATSRRDIEKILDGKFAPAPEAPSAPTQFRRAVADPFGCDFMGDGPVIPDGN